MLLRKISITFFSNFQETYKKESGTKAQINSPIMAGTEENLQNLQIFKCERSTQLTFTCSKPEIDTIEKIVKHVQI